MRARTPEQWQALQARVDQWAEKLTDQKLAGYVQALQKNWQLTRSVDAWEQLHCLYEVQHKRSCKG